MATKKYKLQVIWLEPRQMSFLKMLAKKKKLSMSALVRKLLDKETKLYIYANSKTSKYSEGNWRATDI